MAHAKISEKKKKKEEAAAQGKNEKKTQKQTITILISENPGYYLKIKEKCLRRFGIMAPEAGCSPWDDTSGLRGVPNPTSSIFSPPFFSFSHLFEKKRRGNNGENRISFILFVFPEFERGKRCNFREKHRWSPCILPTRSETGEMTRDDKTRVPIEKPKIN